MLSKRGSNLRIINDYKFRFHKNLASGHERWVCSDKNCKAYLKVRDDVVTEENLVHNHPADSKSRLLRQKIANACKRTATQDLFERPSKVMRKEMTCEALQVLTVADRKQIRQSIYYARSKERPPLPKTFKVRTHEISHKNWRRIPLGER